MEIAVLLTIAAAIGVVWDDVWGHGWLAPAPEVKPVYGEDLDD